MAFEGKASLGAHELSTLVKGERVMLKRDTLSNTSDAPLAHVRDETMANVTNGAVLASWYMARHQRYRGVGPARWGAHLAPHRVWVNGTKSPPTSIDSIGEAFELMLSSVSGNQRVRHGEGSVWHGVDTLISPPDAAIFSALLWEHRPALLVEIGTECGGSALFFASILRAIHPTVRAHPLVVTYDVQPTYWRCLKYHPSGRRTHKGYQSALWKHFVADGTIEARIADVTAPSEQALIAGYAAQAHRMGESVWVLDDGDHFATPLLVHFHLFARHVTPGSGYYIIADTRLERTCRAAWLAMRHRTPYCLKILTREGGPARAVHYLEHHHPLLACGAFTVDRTAEMWALTQHPGGWLRRAAGGAGASCGEQNGSSVALG